MGSLMPGWDAAAMAKLPASFVEKEDEGSPAGYFAKLEKARSARHPDAPNFTRSSMDAPPMDLGRKSSTKEGTDLKRGSLHSSHRATTDWEAELKALGGRKVEPQTEDTPEQREVKAWWNHLEAGALNMHPDVPEDHTTKGFVPQFDITGQNVKLQYAAPSV